MPTLEDIGAAVLEHTPRPVRVTYTEDDYLGRVLSVETTAPGLQQWFAVFGAYESAKDDVGHLIVGHHTEDDAVTGPRHDLILVPELVAETILAALA